MEERLQRGKTTQCVELHDAGPVRGQSLGRRLRLASLDFADAPRTSDGNPGTMKTTLITTGPQTKGLTQPLFTNNETIG